MKMVNALPFIHQPDLGARKARDESAADWWCQTATAFLRAGNPCKTAVNLTDNRIFCRPKDSAKQDRVEEQVPVHSASLSRVSTD